jgi:hypothetical protein
MVPALGLLFALPCFIGLIVLMDSRRLIVQFAVSLAGAGLVWAACTGLYVFLVSRLARYLRETERWDQDAESACWELQRYQSPEEIHAACLHIWRRNLRCNKAVLFLQSGQSYQAQLIQGEPEAPPEVQFSTHSLLAQKLRQGGHQRCHAITDLRTGRPIRGPHDHPSKFVREQALLEALDARFAVPLLRGASLLGFWVFGPSEAGDVYEAYHLCFAIAVAMQAVRSLAAGEAARMAADRLRAEAQAQTVPKLAQEVRCLLPESARPIVSGLAYAAEWRLPNSDPGGLLFDLQVLPSGDACFLWAYSERSDELALSEMLRLKLRFRQEEAVLDRSLQQFAGDAATALFVARFCPANGSLGYVSSGIVPPILLRHNDSGAEILRLPAQTSKEESIRLRSRDLLTFPGALSWPVNAMEHENGLLSRILESSGEPPGETVRSLLSERSEIPGPQFLLLIRTDGRKESVATA